MKNKSNSKSVEKTADKNVFASTKDELANLKLKFEKVKQDTEELIASAKHLSDTGMDEAKELVEMAKQSLQEMLSKYSKASTFSDKN